MAGRLVGRAVASVSNLLDLRLAVVGGSVAGGVVAGGDVAGGAVVAGAPETGLDEMICAGVPPNT